VVADDPVTVQPQARLRVIGIPPRPRVAEPQRGQHMQGRLVRPRVLHGDLHQQIPRAGLGIIDGDHPIPGIVECTGVDQLVFGFQLAPAGVLGDQVGVGEFPLRVVVAPGVPGMGRGAVQVPPVFLDVLSVVALSPGQPEHPLLQNRIDAIPHTERQAPVLRLVAEPGHAVCLRSTGTPGTGHARAERTTMRHRRRCSPRARCPHARSDRYGPQSRHSGVPAPVSASRTRSAPETGSTDRRVA